MSIINPRSEYDNSTINKINTTTINVTNEKIFYNNVGYQYIPYYVFLGNYADHVLAIVLYYSNSNTENNTSSNKNR